MRKIALNDVGTMTRFIRKAGIKEEIERCFEKGKEKGVKREKLGMEFLWNVMEKSFEKECECELYAMIASILEVGTEEVQFMPLDKLWEQLKLLAKENDLESFFQQVSKTTFGQTVKNSYTEGMGMPSE